MGSRQPGLLLASAGKPGSTDYDAGRGGGRRLLTTGCCNTRSANFIGFSARRRLRQKEALDATAGSKTSAAPAVVAEGRFAMKAVCDVLGVAG